MAQLTTSLLVQSALALANHQMVAMVLVRRGDADNGEILVRLDQPDGSAFLERRILTLEGDYEWSRVSPAPYTSEDADAYCDRAIQYDPDCWIIAIDSMIGDNPLRDLPI